MTDLSRPPCAGGAYLWTIYSRHEKLDVVKTMVGGCWFRAGQISENPQSNMEKLRGFARRRGISDLSAALFDRFVTYLFGQFKKRLLAIELFQYDLGAERWH